MRVSSWLVLPLLLGVVSYVLIYGVVDMEGGDAHKLSVANSSSNIDALDGQEKQSLGEDFCCCTMDEVNEGTKAISQLLNNVTKRPFFRFFKVNLDKPCPYWAVQLLCTSEENSCQICTCDANDVPEALKYPHDMSDLSVIDSRVSYETPNPSNVDKWGIWKYTDSAASYVDLYQNPEGNTGYSGPMAARVWQAIYKENCMTEVLPVDDLEDKKQCKEEQIFKKLISGLHTSITMHVAAFFHKDENGTSPLKRYGVLRNPDASYFPNCGMYKRIVSNKEFIGNLHILYQFVLRALAKAKTVFLSDLNALNSGLGGEATAEDQFLHVELQELFDTHLLCSPTFNETKFLESEKAQLLIPQMKQMMYNITTLMDCVTCEKCRVWGKLEAMGIATALKIVMNPSDRILTLGRGEKVSLVNLARQLAISVEASHVVGEACQEMKGSQAKG